MSEVVKRKRGRPKKDESQGKPQNGNLSVDNKTTLPDETVGEIVKVKHKRPKRSENYKEHLAPGVMSQMIMNAVGLQKMGKVNMYDPDAVNQRVDEYLQYCIEHDMKPTVESMALAFSTNRTQLWKWKEGVESSLPEESRNAIRRGYTLMNQLLSQNLVDGTINPIAAFFLLKNNHGYKDQTDVVVSATNPYETGSGGDVRDKYIEGAKADVLGDGKIE